MDLLMKKDLNKEEYLVVHCICIFGMKKVASEKIQKILLVEENKTAFRDFFGSSSYLFAIQSGESINFQMDVPSLDKIKKKIILILKPRNDKNAPSIDDKNVQTEVVMMEVNKQILENLYLLCQEVYLPVLGNPLNQIGWSDLVSKDLMDKFHTFLAGTYVTIGQVKGRTLLPLPPNDVTSSEKASSKEKAHILEGAIITWTKQIKNVLKQDPESALKNGNHPDPLTEIDFWKNKSENLNSICEQLNSERIKKVLKFLEQNKSTYTGPFSKLQKEVQTAKQEANENFKYLQTLFDLFNQLTDTGKEFTEIPDLFIPVMHVILLIYTYSQYYNTPSRLVVLIREICNAIINQCKNSIDGDKIFAYIKNEEPKEAHDKLTLALDVCSKFKDAYFEYKAKAKNQWKITTNALFVRLDSFSERCQDIMHLTSTIIQFNKLQKIEIGNTKGKQLTSSIMQIFDEFNKAVDDFTHVNYDIMDIEKRQFDDDFYKFRCRIKELERRLGSILTQGFDDCDTIIGKFKLLDSFEGLLNRPIIQDELEKKHITLLELYKQDLKTVQSIFLEGKSLVDKMDERAPISNNLPPISGALNWTSGLLERIKEPMDRLSQLSQSIQDREEYKDVQKLYASLCKNLREFEEQKIKQWEQGVEESTEEKLNQFLLHRVESDVAEEGFLAVNFDPVLVRLLREVKYLLLLDINVPQRASSLYQKVDVYRRQTGNLELIVNMYNDILATLLPVEKPLLADRIEKINKSLQPGIDQLKWNSSNIDPFINQCMLIVKDVDELVKKMKDNVKKMQEMMGKWEKPLFERKMKPMLPEDLEQNHQSSVMPRLEDIKNNGKEIHRLMKDTADNVKPDKKSITWMAYVDYVNGLVIDGITRGINGSMSYLSDQISIQFNKHHQYPPMFDIKVDLRDREVRFDPPIETSQRGNGIRDIITKIINDFISLAIQMPRLDTNNGDYLVEIKDQFELFGSLQVIQNHLGEIEQATQNFIMQYKDFEFLWKETLQNNFASFIDQGDDPREKVHKKINADGEEEEDETFKWMADKILVGVQTKKPSLELFDEKVTHLTKVKHQISDMKTSVDIGWLRVNSTPLIRELQKTISEWIEAYSSFLLNNTTAEINNIQKFIDEVSSGIKVLPESSESKREKELLMQVMTHLRDVKMIKDRTLEQVEPMKQSIMLLKKHQIKMDEDLLVKLENSKTALIEVSEKALGPVKEAILPLQNQEAGNIKKKLSDFARKIAEFRQKFQASCPYHVEDSSQEIINNAYATITDFYNQTCELEEEAKALNNLETLFDLQKSSYKQLKDCKIELVNLKYMWDLISLIDLQFEAWKSTLWDKIDTEVLMQLIKDMQTKQTNPVNPQNKEIKNWKTFIALNERVKNMNTILPLISQLHSKFMMERHWKKLMRITQKSINFNSPNFCLEDLIKLQLYKYSEEVTELVDSAQKEAKIESNINKVEKVWEEQKFEFKDYKDTCILGALDEIVEFVETHQMELMGMLSSKDVAEFEEKVKHWQKTLKTVDSVIQIWVKVQKNWQRLEPIFLSSEDIRAQLPDDTKNFEKIDIEWKDMMREAAEDNGVISAATFEGREQLLFEFSQGIEICEKALNDYLEQKKKIFPRFYFVSNQALLDILSNGNNPEKVDEYLGDCFDGMKCLDFIRGEGEIVPCKKAKGMFSKEKEYVSFGKNIFTCNGAVENYLCDLERMMQSTLRDILEEAKGTADNWDIEKKRHEWLEDYCAQISLLTTQIMWTEEVNRAFDEVEGGSETAMKDYLALIILRIKHLIERVRNDLSSELRIKIITIITIDVHERDVVDMFVNKKITDAGSFAWQSQLKFNWDYKHAKEEKKTCIAKICDWTTYYNYEYVGNCGRLVITPLTDRCYITLTQALNLTMGGAPAGPAGTGKTETTKDLGRALGLQVVVFNCSDQMNYQSMAQIFMGLSQTGSWGCFDEFNRISIEVLSVISTQVKYVLDALKEMKANPLKNTFIFQEEEIQLRITVGFFITMNPGYAGRTELPENLKALFRSCAMVVPDIVLICENMLMSEGFTSAKELSKKFMTLYDLAKSLLSKQIHYDWGLRAVKSVLRQAGKLKRADPDISEDLILMRALRDFNWPKIIVDDRNIFLGLIRDLFPGIEAETKTNETLKKQLEHVTRQAGLQPEEGFILKCIQLAEILEVRHCCFIIGNPGSGKTAVWKRLADAFTYQKLETIYDVADPKAVSSDELFGCMNPKTKEWKDGVLSVIMRDMNKNNGRYTANQFNKWIILDGDVDPEWIESLNTVMDDNKVLTLVSQERIPLTPEMRLILEVSHLKNATPATVSRGGVLFINDSDVGWKPYFESWMQKYKKKNDEIAINVFTLALQTYVSDSFLDDLKAREKIAPVCDMSYISTLTCIVDALYSELYTRKDYHDFVKQLKEQGKEDEIKNIYEGFFIFAVMWSYGASLLEDKISFNNIMKSVSRIKFPETGQCFDYFYDPLQLTWIHWSTKVKKYDPTDGLFNNVVVPTAETTRQRFILDMHVRSKKGVLYVGSAGTGKTTIIKDYFTTLDKEYVLNSSINFNSYTDAKALQTVIEANVDKRAGRTFGPPPNKTLIYFMDDLNMPYVDKYGTQSPICLIRQIIDYGIVYDRDHLEEKKILVDCMFAACMNPKSGSFFIDLRLSRHFSLFSCLTAEKEILNTIYYQILDAHLCTFEPSIANLTLKIVNATMAVFIAIATSPQFMPTAKKFHYQFNLRDFSKIIQNIMLAQPSLYRGNPLGIVRMWLHECNRVFYDRLIMDEDREVFNNFLKVGMKEFDFKEEVITEEPLIYTSFVSAAEGHEKSYMPIKDMGHLKQVLENKLVEYNEQVQTMNLVLFDQAMEHICRISRIIDLPVGNALLVGVGGSGKQSLSKLSAFILGYEVSRLVVTSNYQMTDLKADIQMMYQRAGVQGFQTLFILTDSQITNDKFLVYINDMLSSGWIPELFAKDEMDGILGKVRAEAKAAGFLDTPDQLFDFFLDKVRKNLHLCLCFSPVGDAFRFRARKFPGIINCTSMDWFHEWPRNALIDVAQRFLADIELPNDDIREAISLHMAEVHLSISDANLEYLQMERRYNYTTPTSFLELISFYKLLVDKKRDKITDQINRLEIGLQTMKSTTEQVEGLQKQLEIKMVDVEKEKEKTNELIEIVGRESLEAEREQEIANKQEEETTKLANLAEIEKGKANKELEEAIPAMKAAEDAVACLEIKAIQELKSLANPPSQVFDVAKAVLLLRGEKKNFAWGNAQKMMNNPKKFIEDIQAFDGSNIDQWILDQLAPIIAQDYFNFEVMKGKSLAAAFLCKWANNIVIYNRIYKRVKPLKDTADEAERIANEKRAELAIVLERVRQINEKVDALKQKLYEAEEAKRRVEEEAKSLQDQLDLANRLVGGLADENKRWGENVQTYKQERITMIGNALVSAAFVSYIGPFSFNFRQRLWKETWLPDIEQRKIPFINGVDPLKVLATESDQAKWKTEGLPADRVSLENASVIVSCKRYPLMIDPQLQGQKWIRGKEGNELKVIQLSQKGWLKTVEMAVTNGNVLMIEALGQEIDAILDPLLSRQFVKKGKMFTVRLGSEDVELSPSFKLYLQTKLFNPHYKPETAAQCTIINFIVTEGGLEDQLLAMVVRVEKPDLEQTKEELVNKQNAFQIELAKLEDDLLKNLSDADPATILQNKDLIESLEVTKKTSTEIQKQQIAAVQTEIKINTLREVYRRVASEGAMLYFLLITLCVVDHMYQYSLESFVTFFFKAIEKTELFEEEEQRVLALREMIRMTIYQWVSRGLFEKHKQIFLTQLTFRLMQKQILTVEYSFKEMNFLLRCPIKTDTLNPLKEWLPDLAWYSIQRLIEIDGFELFAQHLEREAPNRFRDWYNELQPENEKLPLDWKKLESMPFQKLLVIRCLRPDRITTALDNFIRRTLANGDQYVDCDSTSSFFQVLTSAYLDSTPTTPIFFILSPGANPIKDVEQLAKRNGIDPNKQLHTVALGQGQDVVAMTKLEIAHKEGHWVMLQNIHLMPKFLIDLEKKLDIYAVEGSHPNFRLYLSSDPSNEIPIGLLERSIKLTNEPPQGLKQNMKRAFTFFTKEDIEDKDPKIKTILFALCYFHSVMIERRKFGPKGWNMHYPFNMGDLRDSAIVLQNYMEQNAASGKIPWDDLRYIFGEIMYGGHIVDDWDRRFCGAFLENLMQDTLLDEAELFPFIEGKNISFKCPTPLPYEKYIEYIETETPGETPLAFGMHPNAEIDFRTNQCVTLFRTLQELQPKDTGAAGEGAGGGKQEKIQEFMHRVNDEVQLDQNKLNIEDIASKMTDDRGPYQNVLLQECEIMNILINEILRSLQEIELSFKGELTMTEKMEQLMDAIFLDKVPATWAKLAFPSTRGLGSWLDNLKHRLDQLNLWKEDPSRVPTVIFLNRLFNPQSFLTAIKQVYAREKMQELNRLYIQTEITKKLYWEQDLPPCKEGAYIFGFQVEGARWDQSVGQLDESLPKKQFSVVPVVNCRAALVPQDGKEEKNIYQCPTYKTETRGSTYVFTAQLKTKAPPQKWILAGVAIILDVEGVSDAYAPGKEVGLQ